jgi:hypothetical protein
MLRLASAIRQYPAISLFHFISFSFRSIHFHLPPLLIEELHPLTSRGACVTFYYYYSSPPLPLIFPLPIGQSVQNRVLKEFFVIDDLDVCPPSFSSLSRGLQSYSVQLYLAACCVRCIRHRLDSSGLFLIIYVHNSCDTC